MKEVQATFDEVSPDYAAFVDKFKPKKTTDDCYTPDNVYKVIRDWAAAKYGFDANAVVRPFWPGGDYERYDYPDGCVVVDNPPFSILSQIIAFYQRNGVRFFLFGPSLTIFSSYRKNKCNFVVCGANITYANGATVVTSFATNMGDYVIETAPDLLASIDAANRDNVKGNSRELPKYQYPPDVVTSASIQFLAHHGVDFKVRKQDALFIRSIDAQRDCGKALFGGGFLLAERAARDKDVADKTAKQRDTETKQYVWQLSERERQMQRMLADLH